MASGKGDARIDGPLQAAEEEIEAILKSALAGGDPLGAVLKFVHPGASVVVIDGTKAVNDVHRRDVPADCTVYIDPMLNLAIFKQQFDQNTAFQQGRIRIVGDVSVVARLRLIMLRQSQATEDGFRE